MKKLQIKLAILFSVFLITSCAYEPVFLKKSYDIKLENISFSGENEVNKVIENQLGLFRNVKNEKNSSQPEKNNKSKIYSIDIYSKLDKIIISKNNKGDPQKFEKAVTINYKIIKNGKLILTKELQQKYVYNNDEDKFNLEQREQIIIRNLARSITDIIISSIINIDDN